MNSQKRKITVARCIVSALALVLIMSFLPNLGCLGEATIAKKKVIEATYDYLINKAEELQGVYALLSRDQIDLGFHSAVVDANREILLSDTSSGKSVELYFDKRDKAAEAARQSEGIPEDSSYKISTWSNALGLLVGEETNELWVVTINEWKWQYYERTGEVKGKNSEAIQLLEEITLKRYYNQQYGYSLNYPPGWNVLDIIKGAVSISSVSSDGMMQRAIFVNILPKIHGLGLTDYAEDRVNSFPHEDYQIYLAEGDQIPSGIVAYITGLRFENLEALGNYIEYEARWYFIEKDGDICEILTVAKPYPYESSTFLFDPYPSFRFQP